MQSDGTVTPATDALRAAERRFEVLAMHAPVGIFQTDDQGRCVFVNDAWCRHTGLSPQRAAGQSWTHCVHPDDRERIAMKWAYAADHGQPFADEYRFLRPDGSICWVYVVARPLLDANDRATGYIGTATDISPRKKAETELTALNETLERRVAERTAEAERRADQLRELASELVVAEDRERRALAADLHDVLGQILTLARIRLTTPRKEGQSCEAVMAEAAALLKRAVEVTRSLSFQLSPPVLHELGLGPALEWLGEEMRRVYGLKVQVNGVPTPGAGAADPPPSPEPQLEEKVRVLLFRSVREFLINAVKHGHAQNAWVHLCYTADAVEVTVGDDGKGFDVPSVLHRGHSRGFGLVSVRERLEYLAGAMEIESSPGRGTTVRMQVPLRGPDGPDPGI